MPYSEDLHQPTIDESRLRTNLAQSHELANDGECRAIRVDRAPFVEQVIDGLQGVDDKDVVT